MFDDNEDLGLDKANRLLEQAEYNLKLLKPKYEQALSRLEWCKDQVKLAAGGRYYVYLVFVDGVAMYAGKGKGDRYKHPVSGISSCMELNRDFFQGKYIEVRFIERYKTEQEALQLEKHWIGIIRGMTYERFSIYNKCNTPANWDHDISNGDLYYSMTQFAAKTDATPKYPRRPCNGDRD